MQVIPGLWTRLSTHTCHMTQNDQYRQSPGNSSKKGLVQFLIYCAITRTPCAQYKRSRQKLQEGAEYVWQRHTSTSRFHETRCNAAGSTQRCGQERHHSAGGGTTAPPRACFPFPRPQPRPLSALPRPAPSAPGAWTLPPAAAFHHERPRKCRWAGSISLSSSMCRRDGTWASPARQAPEWKGGSDQLTLSTSL